MPSVFFIFKNETDSLDGGACEARALAFFVFLYRNTHHIFLTRARTILDYFDLSLLFGLENPLWFSKVALKKGGGFRGSGEDRAKPEKRRRAPRFWTIIAS